MTYTHRERKPTERHTHRVHTTTQTQGADALGDTITEVDLPAAWDVAFDLTYD